MTKKIHIPENVTAVAKLYGIEIAKDGVKFMKTDRLGIGFKLQKPLFRIKDVINRNNVIGKCSYNLTIIILSSEKFVSFH